jgi:hypothetical protein
MSEVISETDWLEIADYSDLRRASRPFAKIRLGKPAPAMGLGTNETKGVLIAHSRK